MDLTLIKPLTYGVIRKNKSIVDGLTAPELDLDQRIVASVDFLKLAYPEATEEDFDGCAPNALIAAAAQLYKATFSRPEADAPAQPLNP